MNCQFCKDFNIEKNYIEVTQIRIDGYYSNYFIPIKYCPYCGKQLKKLKEIK